MEHYNIEYKNIPGRGLMNESAFRQRIDFFKTLVKDHEVVTSGRISPDDVRNNIESFIGSVEIPLGLAGPLLHIRENNDPEWVYSGICTTEGALIASMNRGAKAISESGGYRSHFIHQKMLRAPLFVFKNMSQAVEFENWLRKNFERIKAVAACYSNHAQLLEIKSLVAGKLVYLKFIYSTSDASGQNMVTFCTWNACEWINEHFQAEKETRITRFYIDGNGSSDKKVSYYSLQSGRGIHVVCECFLSDRVIEKTLRSSAQDMFTLYCHSFAIARFDGIVGGNLNIANAIAGIFAATGQDLGSIHESSLGVLQIDKTDDGLYASLSIPSLVIGTVGGGTHLPAARTMLGLMDCYGKGKVERFAKLISGFALSLELSTLAALSSGQFARAHQKLGKNKSVNWLLKSEIDARFLKDVLKNISPGKAESVELKISDDYCNGILMHLARRVSKKTIGLFPLLISNPGLPSKKVMLKSKPLDSELIEGLHFMAASVNSCLADDLLKFRDNLEYKNSHTKELDVYRFLKEIKYPHIPEFFGEIRDKDREIYLLLFEYLEEESMLLFNSENDPGKWSDESIINAIAAIHVVHREFLNGSDKSYLDYINEFSADLSITMYQQCNRINKDDCSEWNMDPAFSDISQVIESWKNDPPLKKSARTLIHNDFNPRNVAVRKNGRICIYDWELAVLNIPHRDVFEFLAFSLDVDFHPDRLFKIMKKHFSMTSEINGPSYGWNDYLDDFIISGYEYLITRASFYIAGNNLVDYRFIRRVFTCSNRLIRKSKGFYERF